MNLSYKKSDVRDFKFKEEYIIFPEAKELELIIKIFSSDKEEPVLIKIKAIGTTLQQFKSIISPLSGI